MINLFTRTKVLKWEIDLLVNIFNLLPEDFIQYKNQIEAGLLNRVIYSDDPVPNYVGFSFNPLISKKFETKEARSFKVTGIKVYDQKRSNWCEIIIYFSHELVCGYTSSNGRKFSPDVTKIIVNEFSKDYLDEGHPLEISNILNKSELELLDQSEVYDITIDGNTYYNIKDLGNGDFIAIDERKNIYLITHDPYQIKLLDETVNEVLTKYSNHRLT